MKSKPTSSRAFKPTGTNILIEPFEEAEQIGRIIIPDSARHPLNQGTILAVGPDVPEVPNYANAFKVGDVVIWSMHAESRVKIDEKMLFVLPYDQVMLKASPEDFATLQKQNDKNS